jgi:V/A-type H+-transporting ATPase subunit E
MNREALLEALRRKGEEKVRAVWEGAEAEVRKVRAEAAAVLARLEEEQGRGNARIRAELTASVLAKARRRCRAVQAEARQAMAERLYRLGKELLPRLRQENYRETFAGLVAELPPGPGWEKIRVNPEDKALASEFFPETPVEAAAKICGGLEAVAEGGRIRIVNTLEKRLERAWPALLPELFGEILPKEMPYDEPPA